MSLPNSMMHNDDNYGLLRPVSRGTREHDDPVATIILFKEGLSTYDTNSYKTNYLTELSGRVLTTLSETMDSEIQGFPEMPGGKIPMLSLDKVNDYYGVFNNFSVTDMVEAHDQISKVHMNFGAKWNVFLFGNTPNMYRFNGVFLDTKEYPYYQEFMVAYEKYLSGRKCVENGMQLKMIVSGQIIDGFLLSVGVNHNSSFQQLKSFQLTMLVKGTSWIRTNYVYTTDDQGRSFTDEQLNGMSNVNRLGREERIGLIDSATSTDTSRKVSQFNETPSQAAR